MTELDIIGFNVMVWRHHEHLWIAPNGGGHALKNGAFPWVRASYDYAEEFPDEGAARAALNMWSAKYPDDVLTIMAVLATE